MDLKMFRRSTSSSVGKLLSYVSMVIPRSRMRTAGELSLDRDVIPCSGSTKHLGVVITAKLLRSTHIDRLLHKVAPKVSLLKWMAFHLHLPQHVISRCYLSMVRPVVEYASPVWVGCCKQDALMLEKIQLRVARAAWHGCASLSDMETLRHLNWPT